MRALRGERGEEGVAALALMRSLSESIPSPAEATLPGVGVEVVLHVVRTAGACECVSKRAEVALGVVVASRVVVVEDAEYHFPHLSGVLLDRIFEQSGYSPGGGCCTRRIRKRRG